MMHNEGKIAEKEDKEIKFLTKTRNRTKELKRLSWILKVYLIGIVVANIVRSANIYDLELFMCVFIWTVFCLCFLIICIKINKVKSEKITLDNGYRKFTKDIRNDGETVIISALIFVSLVILSVKRQLIFEEIALFVGTIPIVINSILVNQSKRSRWKFIKIRERYCAKK